MNENDYGSLGGAGIEHHNSVKTKLLQQGLECTLGCDYCGRTLQVTAPWEELICMSQGILPPNNSWKHDGYNGVFLPNAQCTCRDDVRLGLTPDECAKHLKSAIAARLVRPQDVNAYIARIQRPPGA